MLTGARRGRPLLGWLVVVVAGVVSAVFFLPSTTTAAPAQQEELVYRGGELYQRWCATCHANDASGIDDLAPALDGFSIAAVDLSMRTGSDNRMPLADPRRGVRERELTPEEREAVVAYLTELLDLDGEIGEPPEGHPAPGRNVYTIHCAQCHGATGKGGVAGDGVEIPPVQGLPADRIAQGTRVGPFAMPAFGEDLVSDQDMGDMAAYLDATVHEPTTPIGLAEVSKFEAVAFAAVLTAVVVAVCALVGGARKEEPPWEVG